MTSSHTNRIILGSTAAAVALGVATPAFASPGSHDETVSDTSDAIRVVDAPVEIQDILSIDPDDSFSTAPADETDVASVDSVDDGSDDVASVDSVDDPDTDS